MRSRNVHYREEAGWQISYHKTSGGIEKYVKHSVVLFMTKSNETLISAPDPVLVVEVCATWWNFSHRLLLIHSVSRRVRLVHSGNHKLAQVLRGYWVLAYGPHVFPLLPCHQHMVPSLRFLCSRILATHRFEWPPVHWKEKFWEDLRQVWNDG